MNVVELGVVTALGLWALAGRRRVGAALVLASVGTVGVLLLATGPRWRWQLVPLLVATAVAVVTSLVRSGGRAREDLGGRGAGAAVATGVLLSLAAGLLLPVPSFTLAPDTGPVGTVAFDLVDPARSSPSDTTSADEPRRITVQAWWPAVEETGSRLAITDDGPALADAAGGFLGLPPLVLGHLDVVETAAFVAAPPAPGRRLPVVVSLHGWGGFRFAQVALLEQLAADGRLVLAIDHTHGAVAAQPVVGGVVPIDESLLPDDAPDEVYDEASTVLEDTFRGDAVTLLAALRARDGAVPRDVLELADLDRLAVMGHSTGGGAAVWWCTQEEACDGALTWDPWVEPLPDEVRADPPGVPWLSVLSDAWVGNDNDAVLRPMVADATDAAVVAILGTEHRDVTVQPLLSPLAAPIGLAGELDKRRTDEIALALSRGFLARLFDDADAPSGLVSTPVAPPPEVLLDP